MESIRKLISNNLLFKLLIPFLIVLLISTLTGTFFIVQYLNSAPIKQEEDRLRSIAIQLQASWDNMEDSQSHIIRQSKISPYNAGNIVMYDALEAVDKFSEKMESENTTVRITSTNPLSDENLTDEWEEGVMQQFIADHNLYEGSQVIKKGPSTYLRYAMPITGDNFCMGCHVEATDDIFGVFSLETSLDEIVSQSRTLTTTVLMVGMLIIIFLGLVMWLISSRVINRPLEGINTQLIEMNSGEGDLTYRLDINSEDLIARIAFQFNRFIEYLQAMFTQINTSSHEMEGVAGNISARVADTRNILSRNTEQVQALSNISATVATNLNDIQRGSEEVAHSAVNISSLTADCFYQVETVVKEAEESGRGMEQVVLAVGEVHQKVDDLKAVFDLLNQSIEKIAGFVTQINGIAAQTSLLALNASIEASHAGELGKGFAVVAEEVRQLAEHSTISAEEITAVIQELNNETQVANDYLNESAIATINSRGEVDKVQDMLISIIKSIDQVSLNIQGISAASEEQTALSQEITASITEATTYSNETAASAEDFSNSIQEQLLSVQGIEEEVMELERVAKQTLEMVNKFEI
ncbi:MAG TPA: methyl-accepting chemotaxis protein [Syntrophomonadaceae bacterium]|nr:methyl-accepting chemotaxis protein [Syntrophomonadaceae bacterium]